jgi:acyl-CoA synthetase (NDP forming)
VVDNGSQESGIVGQAEARNRQKGLEPVCEKKDGIVRMAGGSGMGNHVLDLETVKTIQAIDRIFNAQSVAVVGASSDPSKFGYMTLDSIIRGGYEGRIYPINPKGGDLFGLKVYKTISDVPEPPDLAVIVVPAKFVPEVLREASEKGTHGAVILSAGFREAGRLDLEQEIASISHQRGIHFIGPNVQGINYLPNKLCAMFFPVITKRGPLSIITQSGSATAALSEWAADEGLGICAAVNLGNQTDLCESDYLTFFANDENTKAMALYIEGIKDGPRFLDTLSIVGSKKPIVILKGGKTKAGQKAASSHTGSLAGSYQVFDAACKQYGVATADNLEHLYDSAKGLATMREPKGNRVLSVSTSGGMGTLAVDEAEARGLFMPPLPDDFIAALMSLDITPLANMANPLDMGVITAKDFKKTIMLASEYDVADIILINLGDPIPGIPEISRDLMENTKVSVAVSYLGGGDQEKVARIRMLEMGIPVFNTPDRAMRGIGAMVRWTGYHQERKRIQSRPIKDRRGPSGRGANFVLEPEAVKSLMRYHINYPEHGTARSAGEAADIADRMGYPVVLKVISPNIIHKSDIGGVTVGIQSRQGVMNEFAEMSSRIRSKRPDALIKGLMVCKEAPPGLEVIVGAIDDSIFGPTIMFGLGGIFAEVYRDVAFRVAPLSSQDAEEMIKEIGGYPLLEGARGQSGYDIQLLIDLILRISQVVTERPDIKELDLNPVRLFKKGLIVLDVRMFVEDRVR